MATKVKGPTVKAYRFTVMGQYHTATGSKGKVAHFRDEVFVLPEHVAYTVENKWEYEIVDGAKTRRSIPKIEKEHILRCFRHVIRRIYLPLRLKEKYEDFKAVRICTVNKREEIRVPAETFRDLMKTKITDMKEEELIQFCMFNGLKTQLHIFSELPDKVIAVEQEWEVLQAERHARDSRSPTKNQRLSAPTDVAVTRVVDDDVEEFHSGHDNDGKPLDDEEGVVLGGDIFG